MNKHVRVNASIKLITLGYFVFAASAFAQTPQVCIEIPDKPFACERLLIKKIEPSIKQRNNLTEPTVCICLSDFPELLLRSGELSPQLSLEQQQVLDDWLLSKNDLLKLMRY